jgi:hypothetical protein
MLQNKSSFAKAYLAQALVHEWGFASGDSLLAGGVPRPLRPSHGQRQGAHCVPVVPVSLPVRPHYSIMRAPLPHSPQWLYIILIPSQSPHWTPQLAGDSTCSFLPTGVKFQREIWRSEPQQYERHGVTACHWPGAALCPSWVVGTWVHGTVFYTAMFEIF